jgi:hypothetical protein
LNFFSDFQAILSNADAECIAPGPSPYDWITNLVSELVDLGGQKEEVNELEACMLLIKERIDVLDTYQGDR